MEIPQSDPWLGKTFGEGNRYQLESLLGKGGMGKVYLALDLRRSTPDKPVYRAIKFLAVNMIQRLDVKLRFQREMQSCVLLKDPRIVQTVDFGVMPISVGGDRQEVPMLVMEWVQGQTLDQVMASFPRLDLKRAVNLGRQIALALQAVHQGVQVDGKSIQFVHRDLKPPNIFVLPTPDGEETIKLGDFGLVKAIGDDEHSLTNTGAYGGTPEYSSPEQIQRFKSVDGRSDLYSLGCLLYRMIRGQNPFGLASNTSVIGWFTAHIQQPPQPFPAFLGVPAQLEQAILQCLHKDPDQRVSSAAELADILAEIGSSLGSGAPTLSLEQHLSQSLQAQLADHHLRIQIQRKGANLGIMLERTGADPVDYPALVPEIQATCTALGNNLITAVTLFGRAAGHPKPDWQHRFSIAAATPAKTSATLNRPTTTLLKSELDLSGYRFIHNTYLLTTSLPDPDLAVAQLVRGFHDLPPDQQQTLAAELEKWFLDPRQPVISEAKTTMAALPDPIPQWFRTLATLDEQKNRSAAIWLSRYCADPEKVLPRLTGSLVAAKAAEEAAKPKTQTQPPGRRQAENVIFQARRHWILWLDPLGALLLQVGVAAFILTTFTPEGFTAFIKLLTNPIVFIGGVIVLGIAVKVFISFLQVIDPLERIRKHPFSSGGMILVAIFAFLYPLHVPFVWVISLIALVILGVLGLNLAQIAPRYRQPLLSITDWGRIVVKEGAVTPAELKDPHLFAYRANQIQEVVVHQDPLATWLNFGDLELVIGGEPNQYLKTLTNPNQVKQVYQALLAKLKQAQDNLIVASQQAPTDPWLTRPIGEGGRYRLDSLIGEGGMGKVYKGFDQQSYLPVAVKFMLGNLSHNPERLERFQIEMRASVYLNHERLVHVLNAGVVPDPETGLGSFPFLVMEYVAAPTLSLAMLEQPKWPVQRAVSIAYEIALALAMIHRGVVVQGQSFTFVHRDLKPSNIFLLKQPDGRETVKIADFGLIKVQAKGQSSNDSTRFIGTARYASPEQCQGSETLDGRSDLYSLGCILYELLAGTNPYGLPNSTGAAQFLLAHVQKNPLPFPSYLRIPQPVTDLIFRCLQKDPGDRYANAEELSAALAEVLAAR